MPTPRLLTYYDAIDHAVEFLTVAGGASVAQRGIRAAIHAAYRELGDAFGWSFLHKQGRIQLLAMESTGTVAYDHTGGTYERMVTLTPAASETWPSWAADATVRVGDIPCQVAERKSDTIVTLDSVLNPGADVASGTSFEVYPHYYALPADFASFAGPWSETSWWLGQPVDYSEMLALDRYRDSSNTPRYYCIREVAELYGTLGLYLHPASDADETLDFIYRRHPRDLMYTGMDDGQHGTSASGGTITVTADSATVTGSGTSFTSKMIGSILRVGTSGTDRPTSFAGLHPFDDERVIAAVGSATSLTLDQNITTNRTSVAYTISDPIDIDRVAYNAFLLCMKKHLEVDRNMKNKNEYIALYNDALQKARSGDHRDTQRRVAGGSRQFVTRLGACPIGTDITSGS